MKQKILCLCWLLFIAATASSQKASIHVRLLDSTAADYSSRIFEVEIKNDSFPGYWVQDIAFIRRNLETPTSALLYVVLQKKGERFSYSKEKRHQGDAFSLDSYFMNCCNCIYLKKGESIKINLPLLDRYILEKGDYSMSVMVAPPMNSCDRCEQFGEIHTKYYFKVP